MAEQRARKPTEHDAIVRTLMVAFSARARVTVVLPHESAHAWSAGLPDLVLTHAPTGRIVRLLAIETRCSMTRPCAERWYELARHAPLTVIVPKGAARETEHLLRATEARVVEYERASDGEIVFRPAI